MLVNNMKQPLHERNFVENKIFWKRIFNKSSKSQQYFFIRLQSFLMHKAFKSKRDLALMTSLSSGYETHSKTFFLIIFYLTKFDDLIWSSFWVIQKLYLQIYASQFMTSSIIPFPFDVLNLISVERYKWNYKILNILRIKRAFLMK